MNEEFDEWITLVRLDFRAHFDFKFTDGILIMRDRNGPRTLTNDMEAALVEVERQAGCPVTSFKIIYQDGFGNWDGVTWYGPGQHVEFYSLNAKTEDEAIRLLKKRWMP